MIIANTLDFVPQPVTIRAVKGNTVTPTFFVLKPDLSLFDISRFEAKAIFKLNRNDPKPLWEIDLSNGISYGKDFVTIKGKKVEAAFVRLHITPVMTARVGWEKLVFTVNLMSPTDDMITVAHGDFIVMGGM